MGLFNSQSLFGQTDTTFNTTLDSYDPVIASEGYLCDAVAECTESINRAISAMYISEVITEAYGVVEEGAGDKLKEFKDKTVAFFKKLWEKIKAWFKNIFYKLGVLFKGSKTFYAKYKTDIDKKIKTFGGMKKVTKFYKYDLGFDFVGIAEDILTAINAIGEKHYNAETNKKEGETVDHSTWKEEFWDKLNLTVDGDKVDDGTKLAQYIRKTSVKEEDYYDVSVADLNDLVKICSQDDPVKPLQKTYQEIQKEIADVISDVNKSDDTALVSIISTTGNYASGLLTKVSSSAVAVLNARHKYAISFLRGYLVRTLDTEKEAKKQAKEKEKGKTAGVMSSADFGLGESSMFESIYNDLF